MDGKIFYPINTTPRTTSKERQEEVNDTTSFIFDLQRFEDGDGEGGASPSVTEVSTLKGLQTALENTSVTEIKLTADEITLDGTLTITRTVTIDLNGHKLSSTDTAITFQPEDPKDPEAEKATLTLTDNSGEKKAQSKLLAVILLLLLKMATSR